MFNFVFDQEVFGRPYPNLAPILDSRNGYHGLGDEYPRIAPCRLLLYAEDHGYQISVSYTNQSIPEEAWYPVGLAWFNFELDYFSLLDSDVFDLLRNNKIRLLFYYHEGDNPNHIMKRLNALCDGHELSRNCYRFISGNTASKAIPGFYYFPDHELFYWRNAVVWNQRARSGCFIHDRPRSKRFTVLSRVHKWWRASAMTMLLRSGILDRSYWSYDTIDMGDQYKDNPIELSKFDALRDDINQFLIDAPYCCDNQTPNEHNQHWLTVPALYEDSYCNVVLETLFDADGSGGTFLTEKTFKPIRHGQPFVLFAPPGSLALLSELGYRTSFTNRYDQIENNTQRFISVLETVKELNSYSDKELHQWLVDQVDDLRYNQELFCATKWQRLHDLDQQLTQHWHTI